MAPHIRRMLPEDIEAILALVVRSSSAPNWPTHIYSDYLHQDQALALVAASALAVQAFAIARSILDITQLEAIVVDEKLRRQGIGAALLQAVISHAQQQGSSRLELEVRAGNQPAIALYERAGFTRDGRRRNYYQHPPEDALLMSLTMRHDPLPPEENP